MGFPEEGGGEYLITVLGVRLQDIGAKLRGRGRSQGVRRRSSERFYGLVKEGRGVELLSILGAGGEGAKRSRSTEGFREILRIGLRVYIRGAGEDECRGVGLYILDWRWVLGRRSYRGWGYYLYWVDVGAWGGGDEEMKGRVQRF